MVINWQYLSTFSCCDRAEVNERDFNNGSVYLLSVRMTEHVTVYRVVILLLTSKEENKTDTHDETIRDCAGWL